MKIRKLIAVAITAVLVLSFSAQAANFDPATQTGTVFENAPGIVMLQDFENCTTGDLNSARQNLEDGTQAIVGMLAGASSVDVKSANIVERAGATSIEDWDPASFGSKAMSMTMATGTHEQYATLEMLPSQYDWTSYTQDYNGDGAVDGYLGFFVDFSELDGIDTKITMTLTRSDGSIMWLNDWYDATDKVITTDWGGSAGMQLIGHTSPIYSSWNVNKKAFIMFKLDPATFGGTGTVSFADVKQISIRFTALTDATDKTVYVDNVFLGINPSMNANSSSLYGNSGLSLNGVNLIEAVAEDDEEGGEDEGAYIPRPVILQDFENCTTGDLNSAIQTMGDGSETIVGMLANVPAVDVKAANIVERAGATSIEDWDPASFGNKALALTMANTIYDAAANNGEQYATIEVLPSQYDWTKFTQDYDGDGVVDGYLGFFIDFTELNGIDTKMTITLTRSDGNLLWLNGWYDTTNKVLMTDWGAATGMQILGYQDFTYSSWNVGKKSYMMIKLDPATFGGTGAVSFADIKQISIRFGALTDAEDKTVYIDNVFLGVNPSLNANSAGNHGNSGLALDGKNLIDFARDITAPTMTFEPELEGIIEAAEGDTFVVPMPEVTDDLYVGDYAVENSFSVAVTDIEGNAVSVVDDAFVVEAAPGSMYTVTYTAKDGAGNAAVKNLYVGVAIEAMAGDANVDGEVNVLDIIEMRNHILGISILTDTAFSNADLDVDESITILDLCTVKGMIFGE